jgi:GNAT superfamily N-acetyltransferase
MVTFRSVEDADLEQIGEWIEADSDHKGKIVPRFFMPGETSYAASFVIEDAHGACMYVRQETEGQGIRLHVQFPPRVGKRIAVALLEAYPLVAQAAKSRGFRYAIFDSTSPALIRFMRRFGYREEYRHDFGVAGSQPVPLESPSGS